MQAVRQIGRTHAGGGTWIAGAVRGLAEVAAGAEGADIAGFALMYGLAPCKHVTYQPVFAYWQT